MVSFPILIDPSQKEASRHIEDLVSERKGEVQMTVSRRRGGSRAVHVAGRAAVSQQPFASTDKAKIRTIFQSVIMSERLPLI
jgi:hypothetical protein